MKMKIKIPRRITKAFNKRKTERTKARYYFDDGHKTNHMGIVERYGNGYCAVIQDGLGGDFVDVQKFASIVQAYDFMRDYGLNYVGFVRNCINSII